MTRETVMLLIDADNVSMDVIEQAVPWVARHYGGPHVRRAYCTAESAVKHQTAFKRLSIRPMVNLAAGKNSTDIALAVDALDLAVSERPSVVVIASSDSDFAPLVGRLREKGCRVVGIGQQGKTGDETRAVYDDYEVLEHRKPASRTRTKERDETTAEPRQGRRRSSAKSKVDNEATASQAPATAPAPPAVQAPARAARPAAAPARTPSPPDSPPAEPAADKPARKSRRRRGGGSKRGAAASGAENGA